MSDSGKEPPRREMSRAELAAAIEAKLPFLNRARESFVLRHNAAWFSDEIHSAGLQKLEDLILRFDAERGVPFDGYAWAPIMLAMYKALRGEKKHHPATRKAYCEAAEHVEDEGANSLLVDAPEQHSARVRKALDTQKGAAALALYGDLLRDASPAGDARRAQYAPFIAVMRAVLPQLAAADRAVVELHDVNGSTWEAVAAQLNVSERQARRNASTVRAQVMALLRARAGIE